MFIFPTMKHNLMNVGQLIQNGYKVLMEKFKHVIHEKNGSSRLLTLVQMTKNQMFPLRIETCFFSQVCATPPKHACIVVHQQSALRSVIEDPSKI